MSDILRKLNGYILRYCPLHPKAFTAGDAGRNGHVGYVYEHIFMAERELGRSLTPDEEVHHLDLDRSNNRISNLIVLSKSHHGRLHNYLRGIGITESDVAHKDRVYTDIDRCIVCEIPLNNQKFTCSEVCHQRRTDRVKTFLPNLETLELELKTSSMVKVAAKYGLSDNGLRKRIKSMNKETLN